MNSPSASLLERARKSYRSLDGVIVVSPKLVAALADEVERLQAALAAAEDASPTPSVHGSEAHRMVDAFHEVMGLPRRGRPTADVSDEDAALRLKLIREEVQELADAQQAGDIVGIADALADIEYVTRGTAVTYGIDLDACLREVHRSNMTKRNLTTGKPILRKDGKVLKPDTFQRPDLARVLAEQRDLLAHADQAPRTPRA